MTSPSPSPTREEVDAELARVDDPYVCTDDRHRLLAAGVLALRAELDAARVASEQIAEWRTAELAELERLRADLGMEMGMRTAALDELETLRRRLWSLLGDDQLSDDDTVDRLRAELARYRDAIRPRTDPSLPQRRDDPEEIRARLAALTARTPQPADESDGLEFAGAYAWGGGAPNGAPILDPQPAVPDGEDERVSVPVEVRAELHTELAKLDPDTPTWVQAGAREEPWSLWSGTAEALRAAVAGDVLAPDRHAVPDGDAPRQIIIAPDTSMTVRAALTVAASQEEDAWSLGKRLVHRHRLVMEALERDAVEQVNGEDVPARLEAAADACEALGWTGTANTFRDLASQLREWDEETPDVRAAVAAALARPTGHQP